MAGLKGFELIEEIPGEGARSFRAQTLSGRAVTVHVLPGPWAPAHEPFKARLRALSVDALAQLIEVGEHEGFAYLITVAPPHLALMDWMKQHEAPPPPKDPDRFSRAGAWKVPESLASRSGPPLSDATRTMQSPSVGQEAGPGGTASGAFTAMFGGKQEPAAPAEPGAFTKMFQTGEQAAQPPAPPSAVSAAACE